MMDQQQPPTESERMTYEEYLRRFSTEDEPSQDDDDPQDVAESLASETVAIFRHALSET